MATKIRVISGNQRTDHAVKGAPKGLSGLVNDALKNQDKFITLTLANGKTRSVIAERIVSIWEE
ncbi:MAG: hypothetical protein JWM24_183 [Solirubrobacterales bacterium]|nr:hypothetical protein [Solirubrobacterales bacterium]